MNGQFAGTIPVGDRPYLDLGRLEAYLSDHSKGFSGPIGIGQFRGGKSNPTFLLRISHLEADEILDPHIVPVGYDNHNSEGGNDLR